VVGEVRNRHRADRAKLKLLRQRLYEKTGIVRLVYEIVRG
jgi:hypothetical protein